MPKGMIFLTVSKILKGGGGVGSFQDGLLFEIKSIFYLDFLSSFYGSFIFYHF